MKKTSWMMCLSILLAIAAGLGLGGLRSQLMNQAGIVPFYFYVIMALFGAAIFGAVLMLRRSVVPCVFSGLYEILSGVSSVLLFAAAALCLWRGEASSILILVVQTVFLAACGVARIMEVISRKKGEKGGLWSLFPVLYLGLALLLFYRMNTTKPQVGVFAIEIMARVFIMLGVYSIASSYFEKPKPTQRIWLSLCALFMAALVGGSFLFAPGYFHGDGITVWSSFADLSFCLSVIGALLYPASQQEDDEASPKEENEE